MKIRYDLADRSAPAGMDEYVVGAEVSVTGDHLNMCVELISNRGERAPLPVESYGAVALGILVGEFVRVSIDDPADADTEQPPNCA